MKVLANDGVSARGIELLEAKGFQVITTKVAQEQLIDYINEHHIEVLLVRSATKVRKDLIDACKVLKIIGRGGVGMDNIDVAYAKQSGLKVINTPGASSESVAELVFSHLFTGVRYLHQSNREMPLEGDMKFSSLKKAFAKGIELKGKTLGIVGMGRIGQAVAKKAIGLGMQVLACDNELNSIDLKLEFYTGQFMTFNLKTVSMDQLLEASDFISLHIPAQNGFVIGQEQLDKATKLLGIVNTARGGVVDEEALLKALDDSSSSLRFAGLDVYQSEPTPSIALLMNQNLSLTPHIGAATLEAQNRIGEELANQIIDLYEVAVC